MAYIKTNWQDQKVERPHTYEANANPDGSFTLVDSFGNVEQMGTPVNALNMNKIEDGIAGTAIRLHNMNEIFAKDEWVKSGDKLYKSKQDGNKGHAVTESDYYEEVSLGGGLKVGAILTGIIDENENKERYLNGGLIIQDQFVSFTNWIKKVVKLYPSLNTTEDNWQTEISMSAKGQCGKFVIDDTKGTIRLPKVVNIQGLFDLQQAGIIKEAGLPNITGTLRIRTDNALTSGAFKSQKVDPAQGYWNGVDNNGFYKVDFEASSSNPIYGKSTTVQEEAVQYPYYIVVATGSKDSIDVIREAELNNPFTFGMYIYTQSILNNISWLRSNNQYNTKVVFPDYYNWLLKIQNGTEPVEGVSVKLNTESYTDYDYVLNTTDETFRLPLKVKSASGRGVKGNGIAFGLTDGKTNTGLARQSSGSTSLWGNTESYGKSIGYKGNGSGAYDPQVALGVTTDATKSGLETTDEGLYLYFYVGETTQNVNLINAGRIQESLNNKLDKDHSNDTKPYLKFTYINGSSGYNIWSNGYCEQWGLSPNINVNSVVTITLLKKYKDKDFNVLAINKRDGGDYFNGTFIFPTSTNTFKLYNYSAGPAHPSYWQTKGYLAEGEY